MTYRTTRQADLDIAELFVEGAELFGLNQAELYQDGLFARFRMLAESPLIARLRPEYRPPVRLFPYEAHMIVYVDDSAGVLIVRVLHGRQDWERHLT